ncbi:MAG TPA: 3-phosphoshikimate 1-carboxyvinyltransferase [Longimicrobiales bacterium]|nr:3-phosphoshikimate 1-carboxyvinyltransferase [Longimicrobiales bacterium]
MRIRVPGDKSLTQRSLILSALAEGESRLSGLLYGGDAESTAGALRALGAEIGRLPSDGSELVVRGAGLAGLREPERELDLGNSGTGTRLLLGVLAGTPLRATVTGDASLSARPMGRVTEPLSRMGARFEHGGPAGRLPLTVIGSRPLSPLVWASPVASAQVKSSILLAGLTGRASVSVTEPRQSRDHTERLFASVGVQVSTGEAEGGWRVSMTEPPERIGTLDFAVPGDVSSAAFLLALAALGGAGPSLTIERVGLNPTRTAFLEVLARMGVDVAVEPHTGAWGEEPVGQVTAGPAQLRAVSVGADEGPRLIDELPLVAALGATAEGVTTITGAEELRAKESDRITAMVENLRALGVRAEERPDGLEVEGTDARLVGEVRTHGDHRIAMAFGVLGAVARNRIDIDDRGAADVSFPGFWTLLDRLAGEGAVRG